MQKQTLDKPRTKSPWKEITFVASRSDHKGAEPSLTGAL